jgi:TolB-like protein
MKKFLIFFFIFVISTLLVFAQEYVIAVSDFKVESRNPSYEFLGKGISRLVASELRKSGKVRLVEREQMNKILKEQEMSLSDLTDQAKQVQIGNMLSAQYLVIGEIIDMGNAGLLVSVRMAKVDTGEIVWQDEKQEKLAVYDYMGAFFAKSLLDSLGVGVGQTTIAKIEKKEEKKPEAIIKTSKGIDAYDRQDTEAAKKALEEAKAIDPANEVAAEYLAKLEEVSPKFRVEAEFFSPAYSAASLGFLQQDLLYAWASDSFRPWWTKHLGGGPGLQSVEDDDFVVEDRNGVYKFGYLLPLGDRLGIGLEAFTALCELGVFSKFFDLAHFDSVSNFTYDGTLYCGMDDNFWNYGGSLSVGYKLFDDVSLGITAMIWYTDEDVNTGVNWAGSGGFMYKSPDDVLSFDLKATYTSQRIAYVNVSNQDVLKGNFPISIESSVTYALVNKILFIGLKGITAVYFDKRGGYELRLIPIIEYWPVTFLSIRAGYEYSNLDQNDKFTMGYGFLAGLTFRIWRFDLNANFTYRFVPARMLPGSTVQNLTLLLGLTFSPELLTRK